MQLRHILLVALLFPAACTATGAYTKPGFFVQETEGRLWVFRTNTEDLETFKKTGEPAKFTTLVGVGPNGETVKGPDKDTIHSYLLSKPGYHVEVVDGRAWVFKKGSPDLKTFLEDGEPGKSITMVGAGPNGMTLRGPDRQTLEAYLKG